MPNPWKLKQEMCEIGRRMHERGLVSAFEGNLSARLGPDRFLCTPSLVCKGFLRPDALCVVDMAGKQLAGERKRSSEIFLHLAVYGERPDVQAVVHTHAPHATAFAITHTPVPNCITGEVEVFLGEVPMAPYATPGSQEMGEVVASILRASVSPSCKSPDPTAETRRQGEERGGSSAPPFAMLLANHGLVSWGKSLEEALHRTEILEAYCRTLILARQLGPVQRLSDQNMRDLMALKQRIGLPDRRASQESFEDCDLCGNNVFGRGFCESVVGAPPPDATASVLPAHLSERTDSMPRQSRAHATPASASSNTPASADMEAVVREITDRVMAAINR